MAGIPLNGVIVVAPAEAQWATRAAIELGEARLLAARLYEPGLLTILMRSGRIRAVAIDARVAAETVPVVRRSSRPGSTTRFVLVHEGLNEVTYEALRSCAWPSGIAAVRELIGP